MLGADEPPGGVNVDITEDMLVERGAEGAFQIRAGKNAYVKIRALPRVEYSPKGENQLFWRGTPVIEDTSLQVWAVEVLS